MNTLEDFKNADVVDVDDDGVYYVNCSDVFFWGTTDCEPVDQADLPLLRVCIQQAGMWGDVLYCVRKRQMRPQGAIYEHMPEGVKILVNAYGVERNVDFFNPFNEHGKYLYEPGRKKPSLWVRFKRKFARKSFKRG